MKVDNSVERYNPNFKQGLSREQVARRKEQKLTNKTRFSFGKSYREIFISNFLNIFNLFLFAAIGLLLVFNLFTSIFFALVLIANIGLGTYFDIKAKFAINKAKLVKANKAIVIRDGRSQEILSNDVVLDDVVLLEKNSYVCADCLILDGKIGVDESFITGESKDTYKEISNEALAGSFVTSGKAFAKVNELGESGFVGSLENDANKIRRPQSNIYSSLKRLFVVIAFGILIIFAFVLFALLFQGKATSADKASFELLAASIVGMVPGCLYLLVITALAVSAVRLSKKKAVVLDNYSTEMLARANVLCVDKTGTLTDGGLTIKKVISLRGDYSEIYINQAISNVLCATQDYNTTAKALRSYFSLELSSGVIATLPFYSVNKYSGATFRGDKTFLIGAPENLPLSNKAGVIKRCEEFTKNGYRVIILGEGRGLIRDNIYTGIVEAVALVVLREHIRDDAIETFNWFKNRGVDIKIISGDDVTTTAAIASEIGIDGSSKYVSLEGLSIYDVKNIACSYNVFGMATAEQKEAIVMALKEAGETVATIGNGANDILAFKRSDCSIAMADSADVAKNASQIVLADSSFATLCEIVNEGEMVTNNLQKIASLYITKTMFVAILTLVFALASIFTFNSNTHYPFITNNMYLLEIVICGYAVISILFEKGESKIKGSFLKNVLKNAIPAAVMITTSVLVIFWLYILQLGNHLNLGIYNTGTAVTMSVIAFMTLYFVYLYKLCLPLNKYRKITLIVALAISVAFLVVSAIVSYALGKKEPILGMSFIDMSGPAYLTTIILIIILSLIYLVTYRFISIFKGDKNNED